MKSSPLFVLLAFLAFAVGCQDSPVTGPAESQSPSLDKSEKAAPVPSGLIKIDEVIQINRPNTTSQSAHISGSATFDVTLEPILLNDFYSVKLGLSANLVPMSKNAPAWSFSGKSEDLVSFNSPSPTPAPMASVSLTKKYVAGDEGYSIVLTVVYKVTRTTVSIDDMFCDEYFK